MSIGIYEYMYIRSLCIKRVVRMMSGIWKRFKSISAIRSNNVSNVTIKKKHTFFCRLIACRHGWDAYVIIKRLANLVQSD